jgi:hypothetical protein
MIRRVLTAPITLVLLPVRVIRGIASLKFSTILAIGTGAVAAFTAARRLMDRADTVQDLPASLQQPAARARTSLITWRGRLAQAIHDANEEEATAEDQLRQEYLRQAGRLD